MDIMMFQEHHLNEQRIRNYGTILPGNWEMFWSSAIGTSGTQGGVCMAIAQQWKENIICKEIIVPGRAQYIVIKDLQTTWGYLNIYAPNHASARKHFWYEITNALPNVSHWCVAGDFNMIEDPLDRRGGSAATIHGEELANWERMCLKLCILDAWHMPNVYRSQESLCFSRSDRRIGGTNLSRLDRFYVGEAFVSNGGTITIMPGTTFSDHAPVILTTFGRSTTMPLRLRIPEKVMLDDRSYSRVRDIWITKDNMDESISAKVAYALKELSQYFAAISKAEYMEYRDKENKLRALLISLQRLQQARPQCAWVAKHLEEARRQVQHMEDYRSQFHYHNFASRWTQVGDRCTSQFFKVKNPKQKSNITCCMRNENGELETDPNGVREIATKFYVDLLSEEPMSEEIRQKRTMVWAEIQPKVTRAMQESLVVPITELEVHKALHSLSDNSCPGVDGLTPRFYKKYWEILKDDLTAAFQHMFECGEMPMSVSEGLIYLIPKAEGVSEDIRKWRPITLLNTSYKIFAKLLSSRLQELLPNIIHVSQTGFMRERSIMDNIFTFWEATAAATKNKQHLAVLLLDFEKAYDRVDWNFLEGTMYRMGFGIPWIKGISCLYRNAQSQVLLAGGVGSRFNITRSVRQGCPLAPFLFLLFSEAMHLFLTAQSTGLRGLAMPLNGQDILDSELADDTALYVDGMLTNLQQVEWALLQFCTASGAKLNWEKTVAFWVSNEPPPRWTPHPNFEWTQKGVAVRYLGVQVGIDLAPELHVAPLLLTLRKKLFLWGHAKLSLAGRVVVANHVLLATVWYIASSWLFSKSCIGQIRRLVRNFIWAGEDRCHIRAKVAWSTLIAPKIHGGLGIIDPMDQCMALLTKFIVRGLLPGNAPWKQLLKQRLYRCAPPMGGLWSDSIRWIFIPDKRYVMTRHWEDKFFNGILRAWEHVHQGLGYDAPTCEEEYLRQHLVWNPNMRLPSGHMLGSRRRLDWAKFDAGPGASVDAWKSFFALPTNVRSELLTSLRGGQIMCDQVQAVLGHLSSTIWSFNPSRWEGAFTRLQVMVGVRGYFANGSFQDYVLDEDGVISRSLIQSEVLQYATFSKIRVLAYDGAKWIIDPQLEAIKEHWKLRIFEKKPLTRLQWDPGEFWWKDPFDHSGKKCGFFQYSVKIGRHILTAQRRTTPGATQFWTQQGITIEFLSKFWVKLWARKQDMKINAFHWLLVHRAVPVGQWLERSGGPTMCIYCSCQMETLKHCFWECQAAQQVWRRVCRILASMFTDGSFCWGMVAWATLTPMIWAYEASPNDTVIKIQGGRLGVVQRSHMDIPYMLKTMQEVWELLSTTTMWFLWTARCSKAFDNITVHPVEIVRNVWMQMVHTLRGQYDDIKGETDAAVLQRLQFTSYWKKGPFFTLENTKPRWCLTPPLWLFPPPIR